MELNFTLLVLWGGIPHQSKDCWNNNQSNKAVPTISSNSLATPATSSLEMPTPAPPVSLLLAPSYLCGFSCGSCSWWHW